MEPQRHALFRQWLVDHSDDRDAYGELKVRLAGGAGLNTTDGYNGHKAGFIYDLYEKIFIADPTFRHDPRPRP